MEKVSWPRTLFAPCSFREAWILFAFTLSGTWEIYPPEGVTGRRSQGRNVGPLTHAGYEPEPGVLSACWLFGMNILSAAWGNISREEASLSAVSIFTTIPPLCLHSTLTEHIGFYQSMHLVWGFKFG